MKTIFENKDANDYENLQVDAQGQVLIFTIDCPWDGDSEVGFGKTLDVTLKKEEAIKLATAIFNYYKSIL